MKFHLKSLLFSLFIFISLLSISGVWAQSTGEIYEQNIRPTSGVESVTTASATTTQNSSPVTTTVVRDPALAGYLCPDYEFTKNLVKGANSRDVFAIQQILNADRRTTVTYSGPGSKGHETYVYGVATREALKRFQALFIEYIGVADGKFNTSTRLVMNNVCKGPFFSGKSKNVYDISATSSATTTLKLKDTNPPIVGIASLSTTTIDLPFRAFIASNEPIKTPTLSGLIVVGATAGDMRKTSPTTFSFLVTPNLDVRDKITLQFEADSISDLAGNKNPTASNEWTIYIVGPGTTPIPNPNPGTTSTPTIPTIPNIDIPNIDLPTNPASPSGTNCASQTVSVYDYTNPCYGKSPTTNPSQDPNQNGEQGGGSGSQIMQMLQGLMQGLTGMGRGGSQDAGGKSTPDACGCPGNTAVTLAGLYGPSGPCNSTANPYGGPDYVGKVTPGPNVCGMGIPKPQMRGNRMETYEEACKREYPMSQTNTPACCGLLQDIKGIPIVCTINPPTTFRYSGGGF